MFWSSPPNNKNVEFRDLKEQVLKELVFQSKLSYVLTEDSIPVFYADELKIIKKKMWSLAKQASRDAFFGQARNNIYIHEKDPIEIEIVMKPKNFLFSCDSVYKRFKIYTTPNLKS